MIRSLFEAVRRWARSIKRDVLTLWLAAKDPRVPLYLKVFSALIAGYALSPIDLIPDFIPVLGYLDDLILVPLAIAAIIRLFPSEVLADLRVKAQQVMAKPTSKLAAGVVIVLWLLGTALLLWFFLSRP